VRQVERVGPRGERAPAGQPSAAVKLPGPLTTARTIAPKPRPMIAGSVTIVATSRRSSAAARLPARQLTASERRVDATSPCASVQGRCCNARLSAREAACSGGRNAGDQGSRRDETCGTVGSSRIVRSWKTSGPSVPSTTNYLTI
jgi:hypothetical protein